MKVSDRDRNVKGANVGCFKLISNLCSMQHVIGVAGSLMITLLQIC